MHTTVIDYTEQQLAAAGWAAIHINIGMRLRPGIWDGDGLSARNAFGKSHNREEYLLVKFPGALLYQAEVEGLGPVKVLARNAQFLAERMSWVLGLEVSDVRPIAAPPSQQHVVVKGGTRTADPLALLHLNVATKEPARPCNECGRVSSSQTCLAALDGELAGAPLDYHPDISWPRRCLSFKPHYGTHDDRTGCQLWPEVVAVSEVHVEDGTAMGKAVALIASMLANGQCEAAEVLAAAQGAGISERTAQRAAEKLGVVKSKDWNGGWKWAMPDADPVPC